MKRRITEGPEFLSAKELDKRISDGKARRAKEAQFEAILGALVKS